MYWCLGMYASASTWTFNVVQQIAATLIPAEPVLPLFVAEEMPSPEATAGRTVVAKTHGAPAFEQLARQATAIIISIRDPRDAIASLLTHNKPPFEVALNVTAATARMCSRFMTDPRAVMLRFEDRFFDDPTTVGRIAAKFPGVLPAADSARIFAALRREAVDAFIANLAAVPSAVTQLDTVTGQMDTYDPLTGWHTHHAGRRAEIGRWWHELTQAQVDAIEQRLGDWMQRFGYTRAEPPHAAYNLRVGRVEII